jgi:hypothetical protein
MKVTALFLSLGVITLGSAGDRSLAPVHFQRANGWHIGHVCVRRFRGERAYCRGSVSWAVTTRWRDCRNCFPPHRTLRRLAASGVAIYLARGWAAGVSPGQMRWPPHISKRSIRGPVELAPERVSAFQVSGVLHGVRSTLWVFFGQPHPPDHQIAAALAELASAHLPP